ncbi:MAG: redox-sensing transcriptional repressor Rex [Phycisphaerae bacterium]
MTPPDPTVNIPRPTLLRLPSYRRFLRGWAEQGNENVSCTDIAGALGQDPTQVRKDVAVTGIVGRPRVGYNVGELAAAIDSFLGWDNVSDAFLVGAGNLGAALIGYEEFKNYGMNIVAAFDVDVRKIDSQIQGRPVFGLDKLPDLADRMHVRIGIIAVPSAAAQSVATLMVLAGMQAIWNFAPIRLDVPDGIIVETVDLRASLAVLTSKLAEKVSPPSA